MLGLNKFTYLMWPWWVMMVKKVVHIKTVANRQPRTDVEKWKYSATWRFSTSSSFGIRAPCLKTRWQYWFENIIIRKTQILKILAFACIHFFGSLVLILIFSLRSLPHCTDDNIDWKAKSNTNLMKHWKCVDISLKTLPHRKEVQENILPTGEGWNKFV